MKAQTAVTLALVAAASKTSLAYEIFELKGYRPLLVASSNRAVSTADFGRWTYLTTDPRI